MQAQPGLIAQLTQKQKELASKLILQTPKDLNIKTIAGCDCSILNQEYIFSVFVNFTYSDLEIIEVVTDYSRITLPYISGYLAFREIPTLLKSYKKLKTEPDLIMVDGNGIIHPRNIGIASHLGILLKKPTMGVAKNLLFGKYAMPGSKKGSVSEVLDKQNRVIGYALRSKDNVKPVFVSPGHLISLEDSLKIALNTLKSHKLPEVTRIADKYSKELKNRGSTLKLIQTVLL